MVLVFLFVVVVVAGAAGVPGWGAGGGGCGGCGGERGGGVVVLVVVLAWALAGGPQVIQARIPRRPSRAQQPAAPRRRLLQAPEQPHSACRRQSLTALLLQGRQVTTGANFATCTVDNVATTVSSKITE